MRSVRRATVACLGFAALAAGCMAIPRLYLHEYEADVAPPARFAVEDGRRVELVALNLVQNDRSPWRGRGRRVMLIRATPTTPAPGEHEPPLFTGDRQLHDQKLLERLLNDAPVRRDPQAVAEALSDEPAPLAWQAGYVVSTRPLAVAFAADGYTFEIARHAVERETRTTMPADTRVRSPITSGDGRDRPVFVEPAALGERVDVLQILVDDRTLRVVRLKEAMTIDALLDVLASPEGIEPHVAEELRRPRADPGALRRYDGVDYGNNFPRL